MRFEPKIQQRLLRIISIFVASCIGIANGQSPGAGTSTFNTTHVTNIQNAILTNYLTNTRPSDQVVLQIGFGVHHITKLDTIDQTLGLVGFLLLTWTDDRLAWNASDYGGTSEVFLTTSDIWVPPLILDNAANSVATISDDDGLASIPLKVSDAGSVAWLAPANFEANCDLNIQYYPFDKQTCTIVVSSWMYGETQLYFSTQFFPDVNLDLYVTNGEWDYISSSTSTSFRTLLGHTSSTAEFTITFSRKYSYYLLNMLLPVLFLIILSVLVFILPAEAGEKIGYSLTILLSLSVMMTLVSDSIPPTSTATCILSVYLLIGFGFSTLVTFAVVINLKIHHLGDHGCEVTDRVQRCARILARISFSRRNKIESRNVTPTDGAVEKKSILYQEKEAHAHVERPVSAWLKSSEVEYSFSDIAVMLDKVFFVVFSFLNLLAFFVFLIILSSEQ